MTEDDGKLDLDYIILTAALAGGLTAIATAATLLARPGLIELGKQLPLPTMESLMGGQEHEQRRI